jgi:hypothetical protein
MASEVVRTIWCDIDLKAKKKKVAGVEKRATALHNGTVISLDCCDEHYTALTWQEVLAYGTPEDQPKRDPAKLSEKIRSKGKPGQYDRGLVQCSGADCDRQVSKGSGWQHHARWHERNGETVNPIPVAS